MDIFLFHLTYHLPITVIFTALFSCDKQTISYTDARLTCSSIALSGVAYLQEKNIGFKVRYIGITGVCVCV